MFMWVWQDIENKLDLLLARSKHIMSALTDLQASVADLGTAVTANTAEIDRLLTKITAPGTSDADVEAAVESIKSLTAGINAEVAKSQAALP